MDAHSDASGPGLAAAPAAPDEEAWAAPSGIAPVYAGYDVAINAESRTYWDGDDLVSILSVHTLVCPLIRAELRGVENTRVLVYYHAGTRLGLHAYEVILRDDQAVQNRLGLRRFVRHTLTLPPAGLYTHLHDPAIREMYLHEVIRRLARPIATCRLRTDEDFTVSHIL